MTKSQTRAFSLHPRQDKRGIGRWIYAIALVVLTVLAAGLWIIDQDGKLQHEANTMDISPLMPVARQSVVDHEKLRTQARILCAANPAITHGIGLCASKLVVRAHAQVLAERK